MVSSVTIIGNLLGAPLGGFILHRIPGAPGPSLGDFQIAYLVSGGAGFMSLILALGVLRDGSSSAGHSSLGEAYRKFISGIKEVMSDRRIVITSGMEGLQNLTVGALEAFLPIYAVTVAGMNEFQAGLLWGIQVIATILSKPVMGKTSDRYGRKPLITVGMILCAVSFGAIPLFQNFYTLMTAAIAFGLGNPSLPPRPPRSLPISARKSTSALPWAPSVRSSISVTQQDPSLPGFSWRATVIFSRSG